MDFPGEKLVTKMWETVTEKGIGSLLRPWQIRREGRAGIEVRRAELLVLAQAERDAADIRAGRRELVEGGGLVALPPSRATIVEDRAIDVVNAVASTVKTRMIADGIRKEVNVSKALLAAEADLEGDPQEPPERNVEDDWLFRWRDGASAVSSEDLQDLWGRVLAGEVKSPGTFSLRTLDFLRNLSQAEAVKIEKLCRFVVDNWIINVEDVLRREGVNLDFLLEMQALGLVGGIEALGITTLGRSVEAKLFKSGLISNNRVLAVRHADPAKTFELPIYPLTRVGQEIRRLGKFEAHDDYLRAVGQLLCNQGFEVKLAAYVRVNETQVRILPGAEDLCRTPEPA